MATSHSLLGAATPRLSPGQLMAGRRGQRAGLERPTSESQRLSASRMPRLIAGLQRGRFRGGYVARESARGISERACSVSAGRKKLVPNAMETAESLVQRYGGKPLAGA